MERSLDEDAELIPGLDQCRYCPARAHCPELQRESLALQPRLDALPADPARRGELLAKIKLARLAFEEIERVIREDAFSGSCMPEGFRVQTRRGAAKLIDTRGAFEVLREKIPAQQYLELCELRLSKLKAAYASAVGGPKARAEAELLKILDVNGFLDRGAEVKALVRDGGRKEKHDDDSGSPAA